MRKTITKAVKQFGKGSGDKESLLGYSKHYFRNDTTGRPNQVFVCSTCGAQRPKISKMTKHLNVHKKNRKQKTVQSKAEPKLVIKLPSMTSFLRPDIIPKQ